MNAFVHPLVPSGPLPGQTLSSQILLRQLLTLLLEPSDARACLLSEADEHLWPSTLYQKLAEQSAHNPLVWERCRSTLRHRLGHPHSQRPSSAQALRDFTSHRQEIACDQLIDLLWSLLDQPETFARALGPRIAAEIETLALRRLASVPLKLQGSV